VHGPPASSYVLDPSHRTFQYLSFGTSPGIAAVMPGTNLIVSAPPQQTQCQLLLTTVAQVPTPTTLADWRIESWSYSGVCPEYPAHRDGGSDGSRIPTPAVDRFSCLLRSVRPRDGRNHPRKAHLHLVRSSN